MLVLALCLVLLIIQFIRNYCSFIPFNFFFFTLMKELSFYFIAAYVLVEIITLNKKITEGKENAAKIYRP